MDQGLKDIVIFLTLISSVELRKNYIDWTKFVEGLRPPILTTPPPPVLENPPFENSRALPTLKAKFTIDLKFFS